MDFMFNGLVIGIFGPIGGLASALRILPWVGLELFFVRNQGHH